MRYGLQYADSDPFPQDVEVGVVLDDEPVIVVPEECPECPPGACVPNLTRVQFVVAGPMFISGEATCTSYTVVEAVVDDATPVNFDIKLNGTAPPIAGMRLYVFPMMEKCGHRTRAVVTDGTAQWTVVTYLFDAPFFVNENQDGVALLFGSGITAGTHTGTIQMQIDLTDSPGSETWTDFGPLININDFT